MPLIEFVPAWDVALLRLVNSNGAPWLDPAMALLSDWSSLRWPTLALLVGLLWKGRPRERVFVLFGVAAILLGDAGLCQPLKRLVGRPRPCEALPGLRLVGLHGVALSPAPAGDNASMPSSHVFNLAVLALLLSVSYGGWAHLGWILPLVVGYSRLYTGAHYPADLVVGLLLGVAWGVATVVLGRRFWGRLGPRLWPGFHERHPALLRRERPAP